MFQQVSVLVLAVGMAVSVAFREAFVNLFVDPPVVVCEGDWVSWCERVPGGVEIGVCQAQDVVFSFEGLSEGVSLGYTVVDSLSGEDLFAGEGVVVPLSLTSGAVFVRFYALSGEIDWSEVSTITASAQPKLMALPVATSGTSAEDSLTAEMNPPRLKYTGAPRGVLVSEGPYTVHVTTGARLTEGFNVFGITHGTVTVPDFRFEDPTSPGHWNACTNVVSGGFSVSKRGVYRFSVLADDVGVLTIAGTTVAGALNASEDIVYIELEEGEHTLWGRYESVGGPIQFTTGRFAEWSHQWIDGYGATVSPTRFVIPWEKDGSASGTLTLIPPENQDEILITPSWEITGASCVTQTTGGFTIDYNTFYANGAQATNAVVTLAQSCEGDAVTNEVATITIEPTPTMILGDKYNLAVGLGLSEVATFQGQHKEVLNYTLSGGEGLLTLTPFEETIQVKASAEALELTETLEEECETRVLPLTWTALYGTVPVASGCFDFNLTLHRSAKPEQADACNSCAEGTTTASDCVSFSQVFGRTPLLAGMPLGSVKIEEERRPASLFSTKALYYDHPMMRKLNPQTRVVTLPDGDVISYGVNGKPCGTKIASDSRLIKNADGTFCERFADRSCVEYGEDGHVVALISPQGVRAERDELGITVERGSDGAITRISSVADGVMEVEEVTNGFTVTRKEHDGTIVKVFTFTWDATHEWFALNDGGYPLRWEWVEENNDWMLIRGSGVEAIAETRTVTTDIENQCYNITKTYSKGGIVASEETEVIDAMDGNTVVGRTSGGRNTFSATRVTEGNGVGKIASTTDALGTETSYTYDEFGRVLTQTTVGETTNVITYVYAADEYDRRPWSTVETEDGEIVREETFSDVMLLNGERVETSTTCDLTTIRQFYSAASLNRFEAGKLKAVLRPDGRMTTYDYDAETQVVTQTEGVADEDQNFTLVEGKSTRTLTTYDVRGNAVRVEREAWVEEAWRPLTWETRTYSAAHKHLGSVYSSGLSTDSRWNCTGPLWEIGTDTIATTNSYNTLKQMVSSTRYGSFGALTTTYEYDAAGNVIRTQRGDLVSTRTYDLSGRLTAETDEQGRTTTYAYPNEQTTIVTSPSGATRQTVRDSQGRPLSVTGTAVTPEYHTYGPNWQKVNYGSPTGARWVKTFTDGLGRTVRTETAGANNSIIVSVNTYNDKGQLIRTETTGEAAVVYTYNAWGEVVSTQRGVRVPQERSSAYVLIDGEVWLEEVSKMGDLVQRRRTDAEGFTQVATDVRGNETVTTVEFDGATQTTTTTLPGVTNPQVSVTLDGVTVSETDTAGVTQTANYDVYRRVVSQTDGRNNTTTCVYDAFGRLASVTDAAGATTSYVYDNVGNVASVTNALGNVVTYAYDVRGNKIYEGGATYPVAYEYDTFGRKVKMTTFREETENAEGDVTTWTYDEATGGLLAKTYADGVGVTYTLTDDGKTATRTDARGKVTTYAYNDYGELVSQDYSDDTTDVVMTYDTLGRVTQVTDAAGVTTFTYNQYGELESEASLRTLMRHYDDYGRDVGWSLNGSRKNIIQYDNATGRLYRMQAGGAWFTWSYLPGTNLKSQLTYGGSGNTTWEYEPNRDLITRVKNTIYGAVASQYDYTNDIGGRRTQIGKSGTMMAQNEVQDYGYNTRDELISGQGLTYNYDDIGNRTTAEGKTYTANNLNQYTAIDTFTPQYDADGNQTLIKTSTGIWSVTYNAENRPVRWERGNMVVTMDFDRMGRRIFYKEEVNGVVTKHHRFVYDNYLCVQKLDALNNNAQINLFVWDPTEPVATRPLFTQRGTGYKFFYTCDGNKNVSEMVHFEQRNGIAAHYDYAPFGAVTRAISASTITDNTFTTDNPFRFSSEYHDDTLGLVYYNYRHYNPMVGRWICRDPILRYLNFPQYQVYLFLKNSLLYGYDRLGLDEFDSDDSSFSETKNFSPYTPEGYGIKMTLSGKFSVRVNLDTCEVDGEQIVFDSGFDKVKTADEYTIDVDGMGIQIHHRLEYVEEKIWLKSERRIPTERGSKLALEYEITISLNESFKKRPVRYTMGFTNDENGDIVEKLIPDYGDWLPIRDTRLNVVETASFEFNCKCE